MNYSNENNLQRRNNNDNYTEQPSHISRAHQSSPTKPNRLCCFRLRSKFGRLSWPGRKLELSSLACQWASFGSSESHESIWFSLVWLCATRARVLTQRACATHNRSLEPTIESQPMIKPSFSFCLLSFCCRHSCWQRRHSDHLKMAPFHSLRPLASALMMSCFSPTSRAELRIYTANQRELKLLQLLNVALETLLLHKSLNGGEGCARVNQSGSRNANRKLPSNNH